MATKKRNLPAEGGSRARLTVLMRPDLIEKLKDAAYWSRLTVAEIVEQGVALSVARLEKANGEPFPPRSAALKRGRPVK